MAATGTLTVTKTNINFLLGPVGSITLAWTSNGSGNVDQTTTDSFYGTIVGFEFVPGTGGNQPSNNYSAQLLDPNAFDLLDGQTSANLSNSATTRKQYGATTTDGTNQSVAPFPIASTLELKISGAGASKQGQLIVFVR